MTGAPLPVFSASPWRIGRVGSVPRSGWGRRDLAALALLALLGMFAAQAVAPLSTISSKIQSGDATIQAYILGWGADAVFRRPLHYFDLPAFYPMPSALANMDSLLLPAILVSPVWQATHNFMLTYNLAILLSYVFDLAALYVVLRSLTPIPRSAACAAAVLFTVNINHYWHASQHLNLVWTGVIPLAFLAGWRLAVCPAWRAAACASIALFAASLFSWYLLIFAALACLGGALGAWLSLAIRPSLRAAAWGIVSVAFSMALIAPMARLYATAAPGERRNRGALAECERFSVAAQDWLIPPCRPRTIAVPLGEALAPYVPSQDSSADDPVFLGWAFLLVLMAECARLAKALFRRRLGPLDRLSLLALLGTVLCALLSLGPWLNLPTGRVRGPYWYLHVSVFHIGDFFRTPMRFAFLSQFFASLMAAIFLASGPRAGRMTGRMAAGILIVAAFAEHWPGKTWPRDSPRRISILSELDKRDPAAKEAFIALPDSGICEAGLSTYPAWRPMANGFSWAPLAPDYESFMAAMDDFPSTRSLAHLDRRGVEWIVALKPEIIERSRASRWVKIVAGNGDEALLHSLSRGDALQEWERERSSFRKRALAARAAARFLPGVLADFGDGLALGSSVGLGSTGGLRVRPDPAGLASFNIPLPGPLPPLLVDDIHVSLRCSVDLSGSWVRIIWADLEGSQGFGLVQMGAIGKGKAADAYDLHFPVHTNPAWLQGAPARFLRVELARLPKAPEFDLIVDRVYASRLPEGPALPF